ncbi:aldo/keto reductase [Nocardioides sp.]|uniref:aldo/keto reductase n=1 Tax=Nocardioides sp. TaxID=35761 RepID=UPI002CC84F8A|nr:aldo/keto reductase [Nocardioides sp.]HXH79414.1 aldo/keto reductase [Nocardioides sp.]
MRTTTLGPGGPEVGRIGLGCMGMSWVYDESGRDAATSMAVIHQAIDAGARFLDTADAYGPFDNEYLVGKAIAGRRDEVVLATKAGLVVDGTRAIHRNGRPEHLRAALDASLLRLGTDYVDLYQLHRVDPAVPLAETWGVMAEFVAAGKARAIGLSEVTTAEIEVAHAIHPVASVQSELSLWTRDSLAEVLPFTEERDITFIPFSPLGRGFLAGRFSSVADLPAGDWRQGLPRFQPHALDANQAIAVRVQKQAAQLGITPAQLSLAWVLAQGRWVLPIPGTKNPRYLAENIAAAEIDLPADVLADLDQLPEAIGERY